MDKPDAIYLKVLRLYQRQEAHKLNRFWYYLWLHFFACKLSWLRLVRTPFITFLTSGVFGLMLALPLILQLGLHNLKIIGTRLDKGTQISLYLKKEVDVAQVQILFKKLQHNHNIAKVQYISAEQGAHELQSNFGKVLMELRDNPLPAVILVEPIKLPDAASVTALLASLEQLPEVAEATLDMAWVQRLYYFIELGERIIIALFVIFGIGILFVISSNGKAMIKSAEREITVLRLFGATNALVQRPFLYGGMWSGLLGGAAALLLTQIFYWWIAEPVNKLLHSYGIVVLLGLTAEIIGIVLLAAMFLGWFGAWIASRCTIR